MMRAFMIGLVTSTSTRSTEHKKFVEVVIFYLVHREIQAHDAGAAACVEACANEGWMRVHLDVVFKEARPRNDRTIICFSVQQDEFAADGDDKDVVVIRDQGSMVADRTFIALPDRFQPLL